MPLIDKRPKHPKWQKWCREPRPFEPKDFKGSNCGIPCGPANGVIVIDVDDMAGFEVMRRVNGWKLPVTRVHETGSGKQHFFYKYPDDGNHYGNRAVKGPNKESIFDIKGMGGMVVAPGSIHPVTGKPYTVLDDRPLAPAPKWLLDLALQQVIPIEEDRPKHIKTWDGDLESLPVPGTTRALIKTGEEKGERSEAIWKVINTLAVAEVPDDTIVDIFERYPIGEKYKEKGQSKTKWLMQQVNKARQEQFMLQESFIKKLNEKHAVILNLGEGQCVIMNEKINPATDRPDVDFSLFTHFRNRYANRKVPVETSKGIRYKSIAQIWIESPKRREYEGVVFAPGREVEGYYNLFKEFRHEAKKGDWSKLKTHIFEIITAGNQEWFDYLMAWLARIVQDPGGERPGVAVVLRGDRGCGKGAFATTYGELFGDHFLPIQNQALFHGRFNAHFKNCIVAYVDEAVWAGEKAAEGMIKALITEKTITCEQKFKDPLTVQNHANFIIASNNDWVIPAGPRERRFFVLDVLNKRIGDRRYFDALFKQIKEGGKEAMLYDLLQYDYSAVNLRDFPKTDALLDQIERSMTHTQKFWLSCLREEARDLESKWDQPIDTEDLYQEFKYYVESLSLRYPPPLHQFMKELKRMCPNLERKRKRESGKRVQKIILPDKDECRKQFEDYLGQSIDWEKDIDGNLPDGEYAEDEEM